VGGLGDLVFLGIEEVGWGLKKREGQGGMNEVEVEV